MIMKAVSVSVTIRPRLTAPGLVLLGLARDIDVAALPRRLEIFARFGGQRAHRDSRLARLPTERRAQRRRLERSNWLSERLFAGSDIRASKTPAAGRRDSSYRRRFRISW